MNLFLLASIVGAAFAIGGMIWSLVSISSHRHESARGEEAQDKKEGAPQARSTTQLVVVGDVPREPSAFRPRQELLAELSEESPIRVSVVYAITGMRGAGKTQLAAEYARLRIGQGWRLVAWVDASTEDSLLAGLKAVAEATGLATASEDTRTAAVRVRHWLETDGARRLVVFDNVANLDELRPFLPAAGEAHVILTSNQRPAAQLGSTTVAVDVFSPDEAVAFLAERTGVSDENGARELASELGYLPLALAQAAGVISSERLTFETYLDRLRTTPVGDYLVRGTADPYPRSLAGTILLSLQAVEDSTELSRTVMGVLSVLSEAGVPRHLLTRTTEIYAAHGSTLVWSATEVDSAIGKLASISLVTFSLDGTAVAAHRLVMRVVREQLVASDKFADVARAAVRALTELANNVAMAWRNPAMTRDLVGQIIALHRHASPYLDNLFDNIEKDLLELRIMALQLLNELGDSVVQAIQIGHSLVEDCERVLGPDDLSTLTSRDDLAGSYLMAGRLSEAIPLYEQVLTARQRILGPDHPDTLTSQGNLAVALQAAGRLAEAIPLYEQVLTARQRILGPDHPDTLTSQGNLAVALQAAGRLAEAIPLYEQVLTARQRILGPDHPDTLTSRDNLGGAYLEMGRLDDAIPAYEQVLAARRRVLGANHPAALTSEGNLAVTLQLAGRLAEAIPLLEQVLDARQRVLGPGHPDTLTSQGNLAVALQTAGRLVEAVSLFEQALTDSERVLGDNPMTWAVRANFALALSLPKSGAYTDLDPLHFQRRSLS